LKLIFTVYFIVMSAIYPRLFESWTCCSQFDYDPSENGASGAMKS